MRLWTTTSLGALGLAIAGSASGQIMTAKSDARSGFVFASTSVENTQTASYSIAPGTAFQTNNFNQGVTAGGAWAALTSHSEWLDLGAGNLTNGFQAQGWLNVSLGPVSGTAISTDSMEIKFEVSGLGAVEKVPVTFEGVMFNTYSTVAVTLVGPGVALSFEDSAEWNQIVELNNGTYTLTIDAASTLVGTGPDAGASYYYVNLERVEPVPANDLCENAIAVGTGTIPISLLSASGAFTGASACMGNGPPIKKDVYFRYVAEATGVATVSTCGTVPFDSMLAAFTGPCDAATIVGCADDTCGAFNASMQFPTVCGQAYTIVLGAYSTQAYPDFAGSVTITQSGGGCPDYCSGAVPLSLGANSVGTDGMTGLLELPPTCEEGYGVALYKDAYFYYDAVGDGTATVSTCSSETNFDTRLAVLAGDCDSWNVIACNDDALSCGVFSEVSFPTTCGQRYLVVLGSYDGQSGHALLTVAQSGTCPLPCPADLNGNGSVGGDDLATLLGQWGSAGNGDLDGDGAVTSADLAILLGAWGACP